MFVLLLQTLHEFDMVNQIDWLFQFFTFQVLLQVAGKKITESSPQMWCDRRGWVVLMHPPPRIEADDLTNISFDLKPIEGVFLLEANVFDIKN